MAAAWTGFGVVELYAVVSGLAFATQGRAVESGPFLSIMALLVIVMGPFLALSMVALHAYAGPKRKVHALSALVFMLACITVTSCINFMLLLVSVWPELFSASWRELFVPTKWPAPAFVLDNFVWCWFFGLAMLLAAPVFGGSTLRNALRILMLLSGSLCVTGLLWLAVSPPQAIVIGILGWGAAGPIVFLLLAKEFSRVEASGSEAVAP